MDPSPVAFAVLAVVMIAAALALILPALRRSHPRRAQRTALELHVESMRALLADLQRQRAAGELDTVQYEHARAEAERRLLQEAPAATAPATAAPRWVGATVAVLVPVLAVAVYLTLGEPAMLRAPVADTLATDTAVLARHAREHPRDARAWILLARAYVSDERFADAAATYAHAIELPRAARDAAVLAEYADALGMAQGGRLTGAPGALIVAALALDPRHPQALELAGSAAYEAGDFAGAAAHWQALLAALPADDARVPALAAAVSRAQRLAAVNLPAMGSARGEASR